MLSGATGVTIGGTTAGARDVISNNYDDGLVISGSTSVLVQGDFIGTDVSGETLLGNGNTGVLVTQGSMGNVTRIGESRSPAIGDFGKRERRHRLLRASGVLIAGDKIGTDITGEHSLPNDEVGVSIASAPGTTIGGTTAAARNVISNNIGPGITVTSSPGSLIEGNDIGVDAAGTAPMGNDGDGVLIDASSNDTIGGTAAAARNIISANLDSGLEITASSNDLVEGNFIGTDVTGTTARFRDQPAGQSILRRGHRWWVVRQHDRRVDGGTDGHLRQPQYWRSDHRSGYGGQRGGGHRDRHQHRRQRRPSQPESRPGDH